MITESCRDTAPVEQEQVEQEQEQVEQEQVEQEQEQVEQEQVEQDDQAQSDEVRAYRGFWWVLGYRRPTETILVHPQQVSSPGRPSLTGRKRLLWSTRVLLSVMPRWLQSALGYPVSSSIGRCLSPDVRVSPTKPCGKGSKRKQDELDEDDDLEEEEHPTWVEALHQECADDEGSEQDPDYEPSTAETASEEYCSHNNTEDDIVVEKGVIVIEDVNMEVTPAPTQD
ncbi:oogenesis-related [Eucyclogobius newberryi]|uniref:oogenesis-related n=1 Tax=Eucyclogobius newberryi TaxID=166745 RepID=UPI003B5B2F85